VGASTAVLPSGWEDRLVPFDDPGADPSRAFCLDAHDLVVSKLVAGREKDLEFDQALLQAGLVDAGRLEARTRQLPVIPAIQRRILRWSGGFSA
jgi:hypothetical protein